MELYTRSSASIPSFLGAKWKIPESRPQFHDIPDEDYSNTTNQSEEDIVLVQNTSIPGTQPCTEGKVSGNQPCLEGKSWRAPVIMFSSIVSAIMLAAAHDGMNRSLDGNVVIQDGLWSQRWTSRYGTALAFLIKMLFVTCVGTAFVQRQWLNLSTHQQAIRVQSLDTLASALSTPLSLFFDRIWLQNPLLLLVVAIAWTLPIAAVITPGTLSVEPRPHTYSVNRTAVALASSAQPFESDGFISQNCSNLGCAYTCTEPGCKGSEARYLQGSLRLSRLTFAVAASSQILPVKSAVANQTYFTTFFGPALNCTDANSTITTEAARFAFSGSILDGYMVWVGDTVPWSYDQNTTTTRPTLNNFKFRTSTPNTCNPNLKNHTESKNSIWILHGRSIDSDRERSQYSLKECQLWNASYETEITYQNFEQTTIIHNLTHKNPVVSYSGPDIRMCTRDQSVVSDIAYKAISAAFASFLIGVGGLDYIESSFEAAQRSNIDLFNLSMSDPVQFGQDVEEVFRNVTLSLFSVPEFTVNTTNTISTNITTWTSTYVYDQRDLLLTYGISFLASLICCILGVHSFHGNGSSFQNNFSTYIRAAHGSDFDVGAFVRSGDTGADPLPKRIGGKMIIMATRDKQTT